MAKKEENRFEKVYGQGMVSVMEVWRDRVTGVHYLFGASGSAGGITPLLDEEGRPIVYKGDYEQQ